MPDQITNYQCPACTGPLHFAPASGRLECEYCGASYSAEEIEALYAEREKKAEAAFAEAEKKPADGAWDTSSLTGDWGADREGLKAYNCPSCGAQLICDSSTAASSCPYCGNPTVVPGQFGGTLRPDYVLPFKLDKDAAVAALKNHYRGKFLLPGSFSGTSHLSQIQGIYVPFWLFCAEAGADCRFHATRTFSRREGDDQVTTTEHYQVRRAGDMRFERIPADASTKMPDDYMDSIEPFDYGELKKFSSAYLPGYLADKYDVSAEQSAARADSRCENSAAAVMAADVQGYGTCECVEKHVELKRGKVEYALLPVWTLLTKWNGKDYLFAMNGQTGKMAGDLPVSRAKYWGLFAAITAAAGALLTLLGVGSWLASCFV